MSKPRVGSNGKQTLNQNKSSGSEGDVIKFEMGEASLPPVKRIKAFSMGAQSTKNLGHDPKCSNSCGKLAIEE